jgi:hypothetical protein
MKKITESQNQRLVEMLKSLGLVPRDCDYGTLAIEFRNGFCYKSSYTKRQLINIESEEE